MMKTTTIERTYLVRGLIVRIGVLMSAAKVELPFQNGRLAEIDRSCVIELRVEAKGPP